MLFAHWGFVFGVVVASGLLACSGSVDDASAPSAEAAVDPEQPSDRGGEGEGGDPFFDDAGVEVPPDVATDAGASGAKPAPELLAAEAARELSIMKSSIYEHTTFVDEKTGTFNYDCSGFVGYALTKVLPAHLSAVKTFAGVTRPLAKDYEAFFASITTSKSGWSRVYKPIDLQPGDVIAWLKPADLVSNNTGHLMIVRVKPYVSPKRADEIIVPVTDSTSTFHGPTDTRSPSREGLGNASIGIIIDSKGAPIRYRWTGAYSTKEYTTEITFARPG